MADRLVQKPRHVEFVHDDNDKLDAVILYRVIANY